MNGETSLRSTEARAYATNQKIYKGKNTHLKCTYYDGGGHVKEKCWILHLELKPKFTKEEKMIPSSHFKSQHAANFMDFIASPMTLINEFVAYLQTKGHGNAASTSQTEDRGHTAMLG